MPRPQPALSRRNVGTSADNYCLISDELPVYSKEDYLYDAALFSVPVVVPFCAFFTYPVVQKIYLSLIHI